MIINGFKIKQLRQERDITQDQLAIDIDIAKSIINTIESGRNSNPKIQNIFKIAKYFGIKVEELFEEEIKT